MTTATATQPVLEPVEPVTEDHESLKLLDRLFLPDDAVSIRPIETWKENGRNHSRVHYDGVRCHVRKVITPMSMGHNLIQSKRQRTNLFFGVCPRFKAAEGFDLAWQIRTVRCLWSDIDDCGPDGVGERLAAAELPTPSIVVSSGNGAHLYWVLDEPFHIDDAGDPPQVKKQWGKTKEGKKRPAEYFEDEAGEKVFLSDPVTFRRLPHNVPELSAKALHVQDVVKGIAELIDGDSTQDLTRLLRIPGSMNRKDERNGREPVPCTIVSMTDDVYPFSAFEQFAAKSPAKQQREIIARVPLKTRKLTTGNETKLDKRILACQVAEAGMRSEQDYALCCFSVEHEIAADDVWSRVADIGKFAERGRGYFDSTWRKAEQHTRVKKYEKMHRSVNGCSNGLSNGHTNGRNGEGLNTGIGLGLVPIEVTTLEYKVNDQAIHALSRDDNVFNRAGVLVHVVRDSHDDPRVDRPAGSPTISAMRPANIRERLTRHASFFVTVQNEDGDKEKDVPPPSWCYHAIEARGTWEGIKPLLGVVEHPVLRSDGTILNVPGYDVRTGLLYEPNASYHAVPSSPTHDDVKSAKELLADVVCDFPFEKSEHAAGWLSLFLTPLARFAYNGPAPLTLVDANTRGSGKTKLCEAVAIAHTDRDLPRMTNPHDDEECRKAILSLAMNADTFVLIDSIAGQLGCASLDAALTSTSWKDRILGKSEIVDLPLNVTWCASGNNVTVGEDTARRVVHVRLKSDMERPEEREGFRHPDLNGYVLQNRGALVSAGLTILRFWFANGKRDMGLKPWGSFEKWSAVVRNAMVYCGIDDPAATRHSLMQTSNTKGASLTAFLSAWHGMLGERSYRASEILDVLNGNARPDDPSTADAWNNHRATMCEAAPALFNEGRGGQFTSTSIGRGLVRERDKIAGGFKLEGNENQGSKLWRVLAGSAE